jgi:hypothetical protein
MSIGGDRLCDRRTEAMSVNVTEMLQRLSTRVDTFLLSYINLRDHVDNDFRHFEGRVNKIRETGNFLSIEQMTSERTREMPNLLMPNDIKPTKIKSIGRETSFDTREGIYGIPIQSRRT